MSNSRGLTCMYGASENALLPGAMKTCWPLGAMVKSESDACTCTTSWPSLRTVTGTVSVLPAWVAISFFVGMTLSPMSAGAGADAASMLATAAHTKRRALTILRF